MATRPSSRAAAAASAGGARQAALWDGDSRRAEPLLGLVLESFTEDDPALAMTAGQSTGAILALGATSVPHSGERPRPGDPVDLPEIGVARCPKPGAPRSPPPVRAWSLRRSPTHTCGWRRAPPIATSMSSTPRSRANADKASTMSRLASVIRARALSGSRARRVPPGGGYTRRYLPVSTPLNSGSREGCRCRASGRWRHR